MARIDDESRRLRPVQSPDERANQERELAELEDERRSWLVQNEPVTARSVDLSITSVDDESIIFARERDGSLTLLMRGEISLSIRPVSDTPTETAPEAAESPETPLQVPERGLAPNTQRETRRAQSRAATRPSEKASGKEKQRAQRFTGKVGSQPTFGRGRNEQPYIRFAFAEHPDKDTTIWHRVVATKRYAEKIAEHELQVGEECTIVGYPSQIEEPARGGKTRQVNLLRAVGVRVQRSQGKPQK